MRQILEKPCTKFSGEKQIIFKAPNFEVISILHNTVSQNAKKFAQIQKYLISTFKCFVLKSKKYWVGMIYWVKTETEILPKKYWQKVKPPKVAKRCIFVTVNRTQHGILKVAGSEIMNILMILFGADVFLDADIKNMVKFYL